MAFTTIGFDGTIKEDTFSQLLYAAGFLASQEGVIGFTAQPSSSAIRGITLTGPATLYAPGLRADTQSNEAAVLDAASGTVRQDMIVVQFDWNADQPTQGGTVSVIVLKGSATNLPILTRNPGVLYQVPVCSVTVRPGATTIAAADIVDRRPKPRRTILTRAADWPAVNVGKNQTSVVVATLAVPDPGWPYYLEFVARQGIDYHGNLGNAIGLRADGSVSLAVLNGNTELARSNDPTWASGDQGSDGPMSDVLAVSDCTGVMTGTVTLSLAVIPRVFLTGGFVAVDIGANTFYVKQIPA